MTKPTPTPLQGEIWAYELTNPLVIGRLAMEIMEAASAVETDLSRPEHARTSYAAELRGESHQIRQLYLDHNRLVSLVNGWVPDNLRLTSDDGNAAINHVITELWKTFIRRLEDLGYTIHGQEA